jgi:MOSC domain-containing protein YiiM
LQGTILQINVSPGGLPKRPVPEAFLTPLGFEGDSVAHPGIHGGARKAVLLITSEGIDELIARGYPLFYGAMGENLTTRGLERQMLREGQRFRVGEAIIELTQLRRPCASLEVYSPELKNDIYENGMHPSHPAWGLGGFYAAVLKPGWVRAGDAIVLSEMLV